ncbi:MAG: bifunctional ADP-dependent NAD(P)H-hydrate dehydratase/NAD(P)H-hydrate epimerase [Rhodospirillaceae bacterium]|nr:bifunctional ADP-dependent NAD(P)H-hydrate dehydratase/NAD(P)H-hydrate epimerase [Rhodospirillaceae bacterium]
MAAADNAAIKSGISGETLMERAGAAIADAIVTRWGAMPVAVLCGPGNNGGDGFVVARLLKQAGWDVRLALLGTSDRLKGDAKIHAARWDGVISDLSPAILDGAELVVDALFGAGLSRPLDGAAKEVIAAIRSETCVAVDIPSGLHGDTGEILGYAADAMLTVTFFRKKPGHLLEPGRSKCGEVLLADIGIPASVIAKINPLQASNDPGIWKDHLPIIGPEHHKYNRGYAVIGGSSDMPGAAILAAAGARRAGAGMVTLTVPKESATIFRLSQPGAVVRTVRDTGTFTDIVEDDRVGAVLIGPGHGITVATRERTLTALRLKRPTVLDADSLTVFKETPELLFSSIEGPCVLTPHEGEFRMLFKSDGDKLTRARRAAEVSGAVIVLKGSDTVIAAPDGRAAINHNAFSWLATSGAGDVLAGIITGLLAQGMAPFEGAMAGVWMHGAAAAAHGPGLIAEDIPNLLPEILSKLYKDQ